MADQERFQRTSDLGNQDPDWTLAQPVASLTSSTALRTFSFALLGHGQRDGQPGITRGLLPIDSWVLSFELACQPVAFVGSRTTINNTWRLIGSGLGAAADTGAGMKPQ